MKYIRTKEGIFEVREWTENEFVIKTALPVLPTSLEPCIVAFHPEEIIKQADTIEDLLDGFIVENKDCHSWFFMDVSEFKERHETLINWTYTGFIKTPNGFTYVAKLNKKGELELL